MTKKERAEACVARLEEKYPGAQCSLEYQKAHELLISVRLAAQCTDARVNLVTPVLFGRFPTVEALAAAPVEEVEECIKSCGLYKTKARDIVACCKMLVEQHGGVVPDTIEELVKLPGIGRKTANLVVGDIYGKPAIVCDTHCIRITGRLGLTNGSKDPVQVERQLREVLPPKESSDFCHRMVLFGRDVCTARSPKCGGCPLEKDCASAKTFKF